MQGIEVAHRTDVDLRTRQERAHADVHGEAALDALDDAADDDLVLGIGALDLVPDLHLLGLLAREHDMAVPIFGPLEQHVDNVAGLHGDLTAFVGELVDGNHAFRLEADIDNDLVVGDLQHGPLDHFAFRDVAEAGIVKVQKTRILLRIDVVIVGTHRSQVGDLSGPGWRPTSFLRNSHHVRVFTVLHSNGSSSTIGCRSHSAGG